MKQQQGQQRQQRKLDFKKSKKSVTTKSAIKIKKSESIESKHSSIEVTPIIDQITLDNYTNQLMLFDLNVNYGPCLGISRLDRWNRAEAFGLSPPIQIKEILLDKNIRIQDKNESIWFRLF